MFKNLNIQELIEEETNRTELSTNIPFIETQNTYNGFDTIN